MQKVEEHSERVAYFNGDIVPESEVLIPFRDRSFKYGDGAFDMTRTFGTRIFKLDEHLDRLYDSLRYFRLDPGISQDEMKSATMSVLETNLPLLEEGGDYWVGQRVTRGVDVPGGDLSTYSGANVIVECTPLPLGPRAKLFRDGIDVWFPSVRRVGPESLSPRAKSHNYLNLIMGDIEAKEANPDAWAILLDGRGFLTEGIGSNIFVVKDGVAHTPDSRYVLGGISRQTVLELADSIGLKVEESDIDFFDASTADEVFMTSTSLCICPVRSVQGRIIGDGSVPSEVTRALMDAYVDLVDFDWVGQYLERLED